jgi:hypothetical protein
MSKHQIVVISSGWVAIGQVTQTDTHTIIEDAAVIRTWGTTKGLGQIAIEGPTQDTVLDYAGTISCLNHAVLFTIDCTYAAP